MLPSFTVPKPPFRPRNELRFDHEAPPVSKSSDCSICQIPFKPVLPSLRSPRKPRYEFCVSTAQREPGFSTAPPPSTPFVDTSVETLVPGWVAPELFAQITSGYSLP